MVDIENIVEKWEKRILEINKKKKKIYKTIFSELQKKSCGHNGNRVLCPHCTRIYILLNS